MVPARHQRFDVGEEVPGGGGVGLRKGGRGHRDLEAAVALADGASPGEAGTASPEAAAGIVLGVGHPGEARLEQLMGKRKQAPLAGAGDQRRHHLAVIVAAQGQLPHPFGGAQSAPAAPRLLQRLVGGGVVVEEHQLL